MSHSDCKFRAGPVGDPQRQVCIPSEGAANQTRAIARLRKQRLGTAANYPGRRSRSRLPWAIIVRPYRAFNWLLRRWLKLPSSEIRISSLHPRSGVLGFFGNLLLLLIQLYRWTLSPAMVFLFGGGTGCRFTPSCSQYAAGAIRQHGALAGGWLGFKRICRCHPLGGCGHDPVPNKGEALLISNG
jgi:putative membrane protein insertion efficiency factor